MRNRVRTCWINLCQYITIPVIVLVFIICGAIDRETERSLGDRTLEEAVATYTTEVPITTAATTTTTTTTTTVLTTTTIETTSPTQTTTVATTVTMTITTAAPYAEPQETNTLTWFAVPEIDCSFKAYMRHTVFSSRSPQGKFQSQCWTDSEGLRRHGEDIVVALGTYYSSTIGERFSVTLSSGHTFTCVIGDVKADRHTDSTHRYNIIGKNRGSMVEFIVDTNKLNPAVKRSGDISTYPQYTGNVTAIARIT